MVINQNDFSRIADDETRTVDILMGTHGTSQSDLVPEREFYEEDLRRWGNSPNVNAHDVTTMKNPQVRSIVENKDIIVCAWYFNERMTF